MEKKKAAIYARVSTAAQGEEDKASLPEQIRSAEQHCLQKGYEIVERYIDNGYSGAKKNRPAFQKLLGDCVAGKVDIIVCWKTDRLSRGMYPASALMEVVEPRGIVIEASTEAIDMKIFGLMAAVGKIELDNIAERTAFGRKGRAKKGLHPGGRHINFGYQIKDGNIVIQEKEAEWIRDLFLWAYSGKSARSWCFYANTHGYVGRGGQGVLPQQVSQWLRNPIYKGQYVWNKTTLKTGHRKKLDRGATIIIPCPSIVSVELWDAVQTRLKLNKRFSRGNAKHFFLLRGLMVCAVCGKSFSGTDDSYECYGTRNYPHQWQCRRPRCIKASGLEKKVWAEIGQRLSMVVSKDKVIEELIADADVQSSRLNDSIKKEKDALSKTISGRMIIAKRERQGNLAPEQADLHYAAIQAEVEQHEEEIKKLEAMLANQGQWEEVEELFRRIDWFHNCYNWGEFEDVPAEAKRSLLETIVDRISIDAQNKVEIRLKLPNPMFVKKVVSLSMHNTTWRMTRL